MHLHPTTHILLGAFCIIQGLATILLDLNRTHATHPRWLGHARFHVVWQTATVAALAILEVALLLLPRQLESERFDLAAILACTPMLGFFAALITRRIYGGTLYDPGGIPPVLINIRQHQIQVDMNLVAEIAGILCLSLIVCLHQFAIARR